MINHVFSSTNKGDHRLLTWFMFTFWQPDTVTGDIVFVLQQKEHPKFKRKGDDLFVEHTLSLTEALCGFQFILTHLDNRQLIIKSQPGEVVKPGKPLVFSLLLHCDICLGLLNVLWTPPYSVCKSNSFLCASALCFSCCSLKFGVFFFNLCGVIMLYMRIPTHRYQL